MADAQVGDRPWSFYDKTGAPIERDVWAKLLEDPEYQLIDETRIWSGDVDRETWVGTITVVTYWVGAWQDAPGYKPEIFHTQVTHVTTGASTTTVEQADISLADARRSHSLIVKFQKTKFDVVQSTWGFSPAPNLIMPKVPDLG